MKGYKPSLHPDAGYSGASLQANWLGGNLSKLTPDDVRWVRLNWVKNGGRLNILDMARRFKVRERAISAICFRRIFKDVTENGK